MLLILKSGKKLLKIQINNSKLEYRKCKYPKIHFLSSLINITIIIVGGFVSYMSRNIEKIYNEV
ncbi:hypothetical protein PIROE2DRAFT_14561 [Piromyces sp. E2]|nr:hypothetical protein PIROE2DRAFT_14561 [Piromyces sp. E2]|eukprot:OUM59822.1 hypothetical protein PIROE2DRAFT_14561 [Piromyces sp. E2]